MKKVLIFIGHFILFTTILIISLLILSRIFIPKWLTTKDNMISYIVKGFYEEEKNSLDVLFMGNSDVYRAITPTELWDDYGIASYAYSSPGQRVWTAYYVLQDALRTQTPKVIFYNVDAIFNESDSMVGNYHKAFDNMQFSKVKIDAAVDESFNIVFGERISYFLPILKYHNRYATLLEEDFKYAFSDYRFAYKGLDMNATIKPYKNGYDYMEDKNETARISEKVQKYLDLIVKTCKENNIELILFEAPSADSWSLAKSVATKEYADSHNLEFLDLNLEKIIDWNTDSSDGGDHLNVYGASKVTKYLGEYLNTNYELNDYRNDERYKMWHDDSKKYHEDLKILTGK